ncbi:MAG: hypothetical protein WC030_02445 [Candidatus Paceibacterota bacterium]
MPERYKPRNDKELAGENSIAAENMRLEAELSLPHKERLKLARKREGAAPSLAAAASAEATPKKAAEKIIQPIGTTAAKREVGGSFAPAASARWIDVDKIAEDYRPKRMKEVDPFVRKPDALKKKADTRIPLHTSASGPEATTGPGPETDRVMADEIGNELRKAAQSLEKTSDAIPPLPKISENPGHWVANHQKSEAYKHEYNRKAAEWLQQQGYIAPGGVTSGTTEVARGDTEADQKPRAIRDIEENFTNIAAGNYNDLHFVETKQEQRAELRELVSKFNVDPQDPGAETGPEGPDAVFEIGDEDKKEVAQTEVPPEEPEKPIEGPEGLNWLDRLEERSDALAKAGDEIVGAEGGSAGKIETMRAWLDKGVKRYNALPMLGKFAFTAAFMGGGMAATAFAMPTLATGFAGGFFIQRIVGTAGFAEGRRKKFDAAIANSPDHKLAGYSEEELNRRAGKQALAYALITMIAGRFVTEKVGEWFAAPDQAPDADAGANAIPEEPQIPGASVEATPGKGYEYMAKRLYEQLQEKHLDPTQYAEGSDVRRLIEATDSTINKVVHDIATEHQFYQADGENVLIKPGSVLSVAENGELRFGEVGGGEVIDASPDAKVTAPYHPEAPHEAPVAEGNPDAHTHIIYKDEVSGPEASDPVAEAMEKVRADELNDPRHFSQAQDAEGKTHHYMVDKNDKLREILIGDNGERTISEPIRDAYTPPPETVEDAPAAHTQTETSSSVRIVREGVTPTDITANLSETHGYMSTEGKLYVMGGNKSLIDATAQDYALKHNVSVLVDKSYKMLGMINTPRFVEYVPAPGGALTTVIHNGPAYAPDLGKLTKQVF